MTDDKTRQLENRVDKLESTIDKMMPSRRDALKMGGAALVGGAAMSGTASAGSNQVGTIGSQSSPVDLESEDINNADTVTTDTLNSTTLDNSGTVTTDDLVVNGTATGQFGGGVPANFTYVDQTQNRSLETQFTNNTGNALFVSCVGEGDAEEGVKGIRALVNGKEIAQQQLQMKDFSIAFDRFSALSLQFFVPAGGTYEVQGNRLDTVVNWVEAEM